MSESRYDQMIADNKRLLEIEECPDFTIQCGDRGFNVHRFILCGRSEALAKMCNGSFEVLTLPCCLSFD